jgi:hypothetical protein
MRIAQFGIHQNKLQAHGTGPNRVPLWGRNLARIVVRIFYFLVLVKGRKSRRLPGCPREYRYALRKSERVTGQTSATAYLVFGATAISGFEKSFSSSLGFTTTFSMVIFSAGTGGSLNPFAVRATWRTFVSKICGI